MYVWPKPPLVVLCMYCKWVCNCIELCNCRTVLGSISPKYFPLPLMAWLGPGYKVQNVFHSCYPNGHLSCQPFHYKLEAPKQRLEIHFRFWSSLPHLQLHWYLGTRESYLSICRLERYSTDCRHVHSVICCDDHFLLYSCQIHRICLCSKIMKKPNYSNYIKYNIK